MSEITRRSPDRRRAARPMIVARYDAARTTDENRRHWANADALSPLAAVIPGVRATLRNRARYEIANNSYASGIVRTIASETIGTGPALQMASGDDEADTAAELAFYRWTVAVGFARKLRTMRAARCGDGEAFAVFIDNPAVDNATPLDLRLFEAEQFAAPPTAGPLVQSTDGITLDDFGNAIGYSLLRHHPGDMIGGPTADHLTLPARDVIHWLRVERPGQLRGVPELTPALPLFAQLRRYGLAVLAAAETAADFAAVMESNAPSGDPDEWEPLDAIDLDKRQMTVLPQGWKLNQLRAEQPTTGHDAFTRTVLREIARCLCIPFNIAAGDSSSYNYSSGRLDHQTWFRERNVDRSDAEARIVDPTFARWWAVARLADPDFPERFRGLPVPPAHSWRWPGDEHVDPKKEADAQAARLGSMTTTYAREFARAGLDWEEEFRQTAKERALMKSLGLTPADLAPAPAPRPKETPAE